MQQSQLTIRLPEQLHTKVRILAAYKGVSQNDLINQAIQEHVNNWEEKHGALPNPPEEN